MAYAIGQKQLDKIQEILADDLIEIGAHLVMLIDIAGNIIATLDNGKCQYDVFSLAALAAGNYGAVSTMAKILGEEEFSLLFNKGQHEHMHFSKVSDDFLLITIFGNTTSLGYLRLNVLKANEKLKLLL
jgi:predicted regulator of Ras-like GTPase activity (Roadblock/LC7/MglB family)